MKKLTILFLFINTFVFAQETIEVNLGDFNELKVFSGLKIELKKATTSKIVISGSKANQVSVKNSNGILKVSLKFPEGFNHSDINITLYYSKPIFTLDANEGAYIVSDEIIKQQNLELKVQEGANIGLEFDVKYLTIKAISGGIISVTGNTDNQTIDANTGGIYKAFGVNSKLAFVTASSGSAASVTVSQMLDAKVNLGGSVYYKGSPEELKTKKVIGGVIKKVDENTMD